MKNKGTVKRVSMSFLGFSGYEITEFGEIISYKRRTPAYLKTKEDKDGYYELMLVSDSGERKCLRVHRLVALCFLDTENILDVSKYVVNHKDKNVKNNHYSNLEFVSNRENVNHGNLTREYTSKYPGVYFSKKSNKWTAETTVCGRKFFIGYFNSEDEAAFNYVSILNILNQDHKYCFHDNEYAIRSSIIDRLNLRIGGFASSKNTEILCIDKCGNYSEFSSVREACRVLNLDRKCVHTCLKNGKTHKGYTFKYKKLNG
ncbi:MAG: hypothetical protein ACRDD8_02975 [Bacteroidales bacterium]